MLLALRSVRMITDLPSDCLRPSWKKYIVAGQNKRDECFLLFHDDTRQSPSRSMRRSRWTHTGPALQLQDQKEQQTNQPDEGKRPMRPTLNSELEPWRQAPALPVHLQKLATVFTFRWTWSWRKAWRPGYSFKQVTVERRWDGAEPSIFRDYKLDDNDARDDVWDQEVFNSIWRRGSVDRGSAFPNLLFFLVYAYLVEWENFENRPRPKFFSACARLPRWPCSCAASRDPISAASAVTSNQAHPR